MNTKILIIGQAPPAVKQKYPYDTTLLYDILSWVNITKEEAQDMFDFEAIYDKFPGYAEKGHKIPTLKQMDEHWNNTLKSKVMNADKIWLLGNVAKEYFHSKIIHDKYIFECYHPSRLNYNRIMDNKSIITKKLNEFLNH